MVGIEQLHLRRFDFLRVLRERFFDSNQQIAERFRGRGLIREGICNFHV